MQKIDKVVIKETKYIALWVIIFSVIMELVFLIIGKWDYKVLLGNLWGAGVAIGNFFVMGLYVQKAVSQEEKDARLTMKSSQSIRFLALILLTGIGVVIPFFNWITVVIPLVFPSFGIFLRPLVDKYKNKKL